MGIAIDMILTGLVGLGLGAFLIHISSSFQAPVPSHPSQKPVFLIGTVLFSLAFRLLWSLREITQPSATMTEERRN